MLPPMTDQARLEELEHRLEMLEGLFGRLLALLEKLGPLLDRYAGAGRLKFGKRD